jgi:hypothetical protein
MPIESTEVQRYLTIDLITKKRLNAPAIWLKPESSTSDPADAIKEQTQLDTDLEEWRNPADERNLGVRLVDGFIELKIKSPDDIWAKILFKAIPARFSYGSRRVSSIIFRIEDPETIDRWADLWPRGHRDKAGAWVETKFHYSALPTPRAKAIWKDSSPLPGSKFAGELVYWRPNGKPPAEDPELGLEDLENRPLAPTTMETIVRAIAFATLGYWIQSYLDGLDKWDESLTRTIGGWIARVAREGADINARGKSLEGVCWSPIDSNETAVGLLHFLTGQLGAGKDLVVAFTQAETALDRNPNTPVPGWGAIETLFGPQAKVGIRRAFRAGLDIDAIERMSDLYVYDRTSHDYLDRDELLKGLRYEHKHDAMVERHQNEVIFPPGSKKGYNPFKLYAASQLRTDVQHREFRPGEEPGAIMRRSPVHGLVKGEDQHADEYLVLNTFPGFFIRPVAVVDQGVMATALTMLDRMLGLLTQDNDAQIKWLKQFIAWIMQHPAVKAQVCPIIVGGQGIGKSLFGENLMKALLGSMAGTADAGSLRDNRFLITPFIGKLVTFIDEVKLESVGAINIIKKLVRSDHISGQVKFKDQHDHYIPSRLMIASNSPDIGLTPSDAADRAFFFIMSWTAENKRMTDREFAEWSISLKPFYAEFVQALESVIFKQHLMRYFVDFEVTRIELEDLQHSSRNDENIVRSTMSKAREAARAIVADARVYQGEDITKWFTTAILREAIRLIDGPRTKIEVADVMMEFERAGVVETVRGDLRKFKYKYGTLLQKMGQAHNLPITNNWDYEPDDYGDNDVASVEGGKTWRGLRQKGATQQRRPFDPDRMDPFS